MQQWKCWKSIVGDLWDLLGKTFSESYLPHTIVKAKTEYSRVPDESRSHLELTLEARAEPSLLGAGLVTGECPVTNAPDALFLST